MKNPLERPDGTGVSRTKLTALAAMAYPLIEPYLNEGALDPESVRRFAPYVLLGLGLYYLRAAIRGNPPNLDKLLESYQGIHERLARVQKVAAEARKQAEFERDLREEMEESVQGLEEELRLIRRDRGSDETVTQEPR